MSVRELCVTTGNLIDSAYNSHLYEGARTYIEYSLTSSEFTKPRGEEDEEVSTYI